MRRVRGVARVGTLAGSVALVLLVGCSSSEAAEEEIVHPRAEFSVRTGTPAFVISAAPSDGEPPSALLLGTSADADPLLQIGTLQAPEDQVFGQVPDAIVDGRGRVAVLDAHTRQLRLFDNRARTVAVLGGGGMGPGEFRSPKAVALGPEGEFVVFDGLGTVSWFEMESDSVRFVRSFEVRGDIFDGCVMGDRVFVHGKLPGRDGSLHTYTLEGEHLGSFADVYRSGNAIVDYQISRGRIACVPEANLVLMALQILPELRAYTPGGELAWWAEVRGFRPIPVTQIPGGSRLGGSGGSHEVMTALVSVGQGEVVLQISQVAGPDQSAVTGRSLVVNISRRSARQVDGVPGRLLDAGHDFVLVLRDHPYAQLSLLRRTEEDL